jgi:hypothetical protein
MQTLIGKGLILIVIVGATLGAITYRFPIQGTGTYLGALLDKHHRLAALSSKQKIIFVGGSNLAFGLDSQAVERAFGLPVVNMGVNGKLGLCYFLDCVRGHVGQGDLIVIVPEYRNFSFGPEMADELHQYVAEVFPFDKGYPDPQQDWTFPLIDIRFQIIAAQKELQLSLLRAVDRLALKWAATALLEPPGKHEFLPCLRRKGFSKEGDVLAQFLPPAVEEIPAKKKLIIEHIEPLSPAAEDRAVGVINDFASFARARGAQAVYLFPPYYRPGSDESRRLQALADRLRQRLTIPVPSNPEQSFFAFEDLYESNYHLNAESRERHTQQVITDLKPFLSGGAPSDPGPVIGPRAVGRPGAGAGPVALTRLP